MAWVIVVALIFLDGRTVERQTPGGRSRAECEAVMRERVVPHYTVRANLQGARHAVVYCRDNVEKIG